MPATPPAPPAIYERVAAAPENAPGHWGNQALKLPARSLEMFRSPSTDPIDEYRFSSDVWLGEKLGTYGIVLPAIVRHVGNETTIPSQAGQRAIGHRAGLNYPGDSYDARNLAAACARREHA